MDNFMSVAAIIFASGGFWSFLQFMMSRKNPKSEDIAEMKSDIKVITAAVRGLSRDRIMEVCNAYADRGYITDEEYCDLYNQLWVPYHDGLEGNGPAQRAMDRVTKLPRSKPDESSGCKLL